jgi:hypothetical protein
MKSWHGIWLQSVGMLKYMKGLCLCKLWWCKYLGPIKCYASSHTSQCRECLVKALAITKLHPIPCHLIQLNKIFFTSVEGCLLPHVSSYYNAWHAQIVTHLPYIQIFLDQRYCMCHWIAENFQTFISIQK